MSHHHPDPNAAMYGHPPPPPPPQGYAPPPGSAYYRDLPSTQQPPPPNGGGPSRPRAPSRPANGALPTPSYLPPPPHMVMTGNDGTGGLPGAALGVPQYNIPPPTRQKSKAYSTSLAAHSDDLKYQGKYKDLKRKVREIEADNDKLHLKVLKTKRNIQRIRLERAILYERLAALGEIEPPPPIPMEHDPNAYPIPPAPETDPSLGPPPPPQHPTELATDPRQFANPHQPAPVPQDVDPAAEPPAPQLETTNGTDQPDQDETMADESGTGRPGDGALQNLAVQALEREHEPSREGSQVSQVASVAAGGGGSTAVSPAPE